MVQVSLVSVSQEESGRRSRDLPSLFWEGKPLHDHLSVVPLEADRETTEDDLASLTNREIEAVSEALSEEEEELASVLTPSAVALHDERSELVAVGKAVSTVEVDLARLDSLCGGSRCLRVAIEGVDLQTGGDGNVDADGTTSRAGD